MWQNQGEAGKKYPKFPSQVEKKSREKRWQRETGHHSSFPSWLVSVSMFLANSEGRNIWDVLPGGEMSALVIKWENEQDVFIANSSCWEGLLSSYSEQCYL